MNNAFLYVRVSSKEQQKEGYSLDAQEQFGKEYAKKHGFEIVKLWKVAESAWKEDRIAFNEMLSLAKKNRLIKAIIFDSVDRMTRNLKDFDQIRRLPREYGIEIHFARSGQVLTKDSAPTSSFMTGIEALTSTHYSDLISCKVKSAMMQKAEQGIYPSTAPLGYINDQKTRQLAIDPVRAPLVARAFELYASGTHSIRSIQHWLLKEGFRNRKGGEIFKSFVEKMLKNPIYYGHFEWNGKFIKGIHEPITTKEIFDKVQTLLHRRGGAYTVTKMDFPFKKTMTCGRCGCKFTAAVYKQRYKYYHCSFTRLKCGNPYIEENRLAELCGEQIVKPVSVGMQHLGWLQEALRVRHKSHDSGKEERISSLKDHITRLETRLNALYDDKTSGVISEAFFKQKFSATEQEKVQLEATLYELESGRNEDYFEDSLKIFELAKDVHPLYVRANLKQKARIVEILTSNCIVNDVTLCPTYRRPFRFITQTAFCPKQLPREGSNPT